MFKEVLIYIIYKRLKVAKLLYYQTFANFAHF